MSNATNEKHGCTVEVLRIFTQDMGLNQFRFSTRSMTCFVKVKLEETRISTILNVFGSRRSNDATRSIFCPNFCTMVISILQLDLMNLFVKARVWFNPITQRMAILIANCRNVPFCGRARRGSRVRFPKEERCAESPPTFICGKRLENRRKPVKMKILSSGVVFTFEEGISTSHVCLKGQQPIF